jgi:hypothetical protein
MIIDRVSFISILVKSFFTKHVIAEMNIVIKKL